MHDVISMTLEQKIKVLSTDILGTLVHVQSESDAGVTSAQGDLVNVGSRRYVHKETQRYLRELQQKGVVIVLLSGMKQPSYYLMREHLPHDSAAIEDGSLVLKDGRRDGEWEDMLALEIVALNRYKDELKRVGLVVDDADRVASFRVNPVDDNGRRDLAELIQNFPELNGFPVQVRRTEHTPYPPSFACYQFVPASSGKANVLEFIMARISRTNGGEPVTWGNVAAFGDDLNDLEMLKRSAYPMTLISANPSAGTIQRLVIDRGGKVADGYSHAGSISALRHLLEVVQAQK